MSRTASKPHFYEIGQAQDSPGKWSRRHILRCSKCDASIGYKALTDEKIRKRAINLGWDVGKTQTQHLCPKHAHAQKNYTKPEPIIEVRDVPPLLTPSPLVTLQKTWEQASENNRLAFLILLRRDYPEITPTSEFKPSQPISKPPLVIQFIEPEETEPDPEDIEVADMIFGKRKSA